ncbi:MAG: hypothetical protein PF482_06100 [Desulfobacteraceae bacterium]|jgi:hypothetical protein|nr:hypothetical protein [Desulfobacteraceae bacterium]
MFESIKSLLPPSVPRHTVKHQEALREIQELFAEAEKAIKYIEDFGGELVVPSVNQLRYTGNHLVRYLSSYAKVKRFRINKEIRNRSGK